MEGFIRRCNPSSAYISEAKEYMRCMLKWFIHDCTEKYNRIRNILAILCACYKPPSVSIISAALDRDSSEIFQLIRTDLNQMVNISITEDKKTLILLKPQYKNMFLWLSSLQYHRIGKLFWIDISMGLSISYIDMIYTILCLYII